MEPPNAKAGRIGDDAAMLVEATASEAGACDAEARAAAAMAVRLSKEDVAPVSIMVYVWGLIGSLEGGGGGLDISQD